MAGIGVFLFLYTLVPLVNLICNTITWLKFQDIRTCTWFRNATVWSMTDFDLAYIPYSRGVTPIGAVSRTATGVKILTVEKRP